MINLKCANVYAWFVPKDFSRIFKDTSSIFQGLHSVQKRPWVLPQYEQFYPEGLFVFAPFPLGWINKVGTKIQGLFRTHCNFQRISRPWFFCRKFKDFQGVREACLCEELYSLRRVWSTEALTVSEICKILGIIHKPNKLKNLFYYSFKIFLS